MGFLRVDEARGSHDKSTRKKDLQSQREPETNHYKDVFRVQLHVFFVIKTSETN